MKVYILGSAGWIPTKHSETTCIMVEYGGHLILLDAGTGVSNLSNYGSVISNYSEVNIVLSHYHIDHIVGLSYLIGFFKNHKMNFYGPGKPFYSEGVESILKKFLEETFFSRPIDNFSELVSFYDYDDKGFNIEKIRFGINLQKHSIYSFGINVDQKLHFATDTSVIDDTFCFSKNCKLLLHECWDISKVENPKHSSLEEIMDMKLSELNYQIGLIHKNPFWSDYDYERIINIIDDKNIFVAEDGMTIDLD